MSNQPGGSAPAGFYPTQSGRRRYWDGHQWATDYAKLDTPGIAAPASASLTTGTAAVPPRATKPLAATGSLVPTAGGTPRLRWLWPVIAAVALLVGVITGSESKGGTTSPTAAPVPVTVSAAAPAPVTVTATVEATVTSAPTTVTVPPVTVTGPPITVTSTVAVAGPAPAPASGGQVTAVGDGVYVVGEDMKPGTYKVSAAVVDGCHWKITKSGTNGADIMQNDLPTGGFPQVTLTKGQDFNTEDCGTWEKK